MCVPVHWVFIVKPIIKIIIIILLLINYTIKNKSACGPLQTQRQISSHTWIKQWSKKNIQIEKKIHFFNQSFHSRVYFPFIKI